MPAWPNYLITGKEFLVPLAYLNRVWKAIRRFKAEGPRAGTGAGGAGSDVIVPNPKLKLLDQVREIMRLKHYSIRTGMKSPLDCL